MTVATLESPFQVHKLNAEGISKAERLQHIFEGLLIEVKSICTEDFNETPAETARCLAIVSTKLQEASFFAKRAMAIQPGNQL